MASERQLPSVLIVGGFATVPPNYWSFRRRLLARGAARVDVAPLWPPDWVLSTMLGMGSVLRRTGKAIAATYHAGGRRPIIVVGHSAGGVAARLAMSHVPFHGRLAGVSEAVGCLVTLGTPHELAQLPNRYHHAGHDAVEFLDRETPGAFHAPRTGYLSVSALGGGSGGQGEPAASGLRRAPGRVVDRASDEFFSLIVGRHTREPGDGIVPEAAARLAGGEHITLPAATHGTLGRDWYGAAHNVDVWWPAAVQLWQDALTARRTTTTP